jgi:hypothetical protein
LLRAEQQNKLSQKPAVIVSYPGAVWKSSYAEGFG